MLCGESIGRNQRQSRKVRGRNYSGLREVLLKFHMQANHVGALLSVTAQEVWGEVGDVAFLTGS